MTATRKNPALTPFLSYLDDVQTELGELKERADNHFSANPDTVSWVNVGDVKRLLRLLREANGKEG